jgi:ribosomal protein L2
MGSKKIRPVTPGMRGQVSTDFKDINRSIELLILRELKMESQQELLA